jgi:hypothetical protein
MRIGKRLMECNIIGDKEPLVDRTIASTYTPNEHTPPNMYATDSPRIKLITSRFIIMNITNTAKYSRCN